MCTVTFIPVNQTVFITSNRDEQSNRAPAFVPAAYKLNTGSVLFPRDSAAGGTWIAVHENSNAVVLLNGALTAHVPAPPYRKSRGLIVLDLIDSPTPYISFTVMNLNRIEPFTAIIYDDQRLFECRWDGVEKQTRQLDEKLPHIWSSATLYNTEVTNRRNSWFDKWTLKNQFPDQDSILHFHQFTGENDPHNDLCMNRNGIICTVSVTSMAISEQHAIVKYYDLPLQKNHITKLAFEKTLVGR